MNASKKSTYLLISLSMVLSILFFSCVKDTYDMEKLSNQVTLNQRFQGKKLVHGNISLEDIFDQEDSLLIVDSVDGSMKVMVSDTAVFSVSFKDQFDAFTAGGLPSFGMDTTLNFGIDNASFSQEISLREMLSSFSGPVAQALENADGQTAPFPGVTPTQSGGSHAGDELEGFEQATFDDGILRMVLSNNMPTTVDTFYIDIIDDEKNTVLESYKFHNIAPGVTDSVTRSLASKTISNNLSFEVTAIYIASTGIQNPVPIDLDNNRIELSVKLNSLVVRSAKAEIDGIEGTAKNQESSFDKFTGITIDNLIIESGYIRYSVNNPFPEDLTINLSFRNTRRLSNNQRWKEDLVVPAYTEDPVEGAWDLSNTITRLDPDNPSLAYSYSYRIDSSTTPKTFNNNVSFSGMFEVEDLEFSVEGYFGDTTITLDAQVIDDLPDIGGLPGLGSSQIELANAAIRMPYENSIGMPLQFNILLEGTEEDGTTRQLRLNQGEQLLFRAPQVDTTKSNLSERYGGKVTDTMEISGSNSNLPKILAIPMPEELEFAGNAIANPQGPAGTINFLRKTSEMKLGYEVEVPIAIRTDSIVIDSLFGLDLDMPDAVKVGPDSELSLDFHFVNDLPFNVSIKLSPYDSLADFTYEPIIDEHFIRAAEVNEKGITTQPSTYTASLGITGEGLENLLQSTHMKGRIKIDTKADADDPTSKTEVAALKTSYGVSFDVDIKATLDITFRPDTDE